MKSKHTDIPYVDKQIGLGKWREEMVPARVTGMPRDMTILRAPRISSFIKHKWYGDNKTFCPPVWWDVAIGSGACGYLCRACFLLLTFRSMRDPFRPLIYDNVDDCHRQVRKWLLDKRRKPCHGLGLGIDCSDSLLFEGLTGHAREIIPMFADPEKNPSRARLILLTKSANVHYLAGLPTKNNPVLVTFSLNPEPIADMWEGKYPDTNERVTPSIERRLEACKETERMGFRTRLRIDPILTPDGWENAYDEFFAQCRAMKLSPERITLGTYREKKPQLDCWRQKWGLPEMEWQPESLSQEGTHWHVPDDVRVQVYTEVARMIRRHLPGTEVGLCKETRQVRKKTGLTKPYCNCLI